MSTSNSITRHKIGGHAKAMVVTGSRLEAVRYKQEFDRYISEKGYPIKTLVAFSGTVEDDKMPDKTYTEVEMNEGLKEKSCPRPSRNRTIVCCLLLRNIRLDLISRCYTPCTWTSVLPVFRRFRPCRV